MTVDILPAPRGGQSTVAPHRRGLAVADALLPLAVLLWGVGVAQTNPSAIGGLGLLNALPTVFYLALIVLGLSAALNLAASEPSQFRLMLHLGVLLVMLYGTAPLVYSRPRYSWLYQYVGVVQYLTLHHHLTAHLDIFNNWPGFFALAAWFDRIAGLSSPVQVAPWAQLFFNTLACVVLAFAFRSLPLSRREQWLALLVFAGANWIAQDYFSAQATGYVLSLGVFAIALQWCRETRAGWFDDFTRRHRPRWVPERAEPGPDERTPPLRRRERRGPPLTPIIALLGIYAALVVTHELSPYVVAIQLGVLTIVGRMRPRWLSPVLLVMAVAYLAPRFTYVNNTYGLLSSIGRFFSNLQPPSTLGVQLSYDQMLVADAARGLSILIWVMAAVGIWRRMRRGRPTLVLAVLAFSPFLLLLLAHYGGEALLRVELFSLPWSACLAASALPLEAPTPWLLRAGGAAALLVACFGLFLPAYFGSDTLNVTVPGTLDAANYLYQHGHPGGVVYLDKDFPVSDTGRYDQFLPISYVLGSKYRPSNELGPVDVSLLTSIAVESATQTGTAYLVLTKTMLDYARAYGLTDATSLHSLESALDRSPAWKVFYRNREAVIYQLR
jgi:hypothetical protein